MAIKVTSKTFSRVRHTGKAQARIDPKVLAEALGAAVEQAGSFAAPHDLQLLASQLAHRLRSSGGRPGLLGTQRRPKIPLTPEDWSSLKLIANQMSRPGQRVSPGQVASALLHERLQQTRAKVG